jgi:hypothetical protein
VQKMTGHHGGFISLLELAVFGPSNRSQFFKTWVSPPGLGRILAEQRPEVGEMSLARWPPQAWRKPRLPYPWLRLSKTLIQARLHPIRLHQRCSHLRGRQLTARILHLISVSCLGGSINHTYRALVVSVTCQLFLNYFRSRSWVVWSERFVLTFKIPSSNTEHWSRIVLLDN